MDWREQPGLSSGSIKPLFPSVAQQSRLDESEDTPADSGDRSWLQNASFNPSDTLCLDIQATRRSPRKDRESKSIADSVAKDSKVKSQKKRRSPKSAEGQLKPQTIWIDECGLAPEAAHRIDRKPDSSNFRYDTLYSGDIAKYRRKFGSYCVGLKKHQAILWSDNRSKGRALKTAVNERYFAHALYLEPASVIVLQGERAIPLAEEVGDHVLIEAPSLSNVRPTTSLTPEEYISQRTAVYNRALQDDPHDVGMWLEFIRFQDEALVWGKLPLYIQEGSVAEVKRKNQQALLERKIAIFERALESNPTSVQLLVGHMDLCGEVWEPDKMIKRWKDLVFKHPNRPELWLAYIEFCQSNFSSFTVNSLSTLYARCISTLFAIQDGTLKSHRPLPGTTHTLLGIFFLYCSMLQQVGLSEKAVACFQALVEFNLCSPADLEKGDITHKDRLQFFETFWDSGVPRFGEVGALGWSHWMESKQHGRPVSELGLVESSTYSKIAEEPTCENAEDSDPELVMIRGCTLEEAWLKMEDNREREHVLPWRPDHTKGETDDDCTDPERMVLFDDISPILFRLNEPLLHLNLVLLFLHFLGAPVTSVVLLTTSHLSMCLQWPFEVFHSACRVAQDNLAHHHLPCWSLGIGCGHRLMKDQSLIDQVNGRDGVPGGRSALVREFISRTFNQALSLFPDVQDQTLLAQLWVEFELLTALEQEDGSQGGGERGGGGGGGGLLRGTKQRCKPAQRLIKRMLKAEAHRNNPLLWSSCALLEHSLGNGDEAAKIYNTVLHQLPGGLSSPSVVALCASYVECLLGLRPSTLGPAVTDTGAALQVLVNLTEGKFQTITASQPISPARLLRARNSFEQAMSKELEGMQTDLVALSRLVDIAVCVSAFECIGRSMLAAGVVLDTVLTTLMAKFVSTNADSSSCSEYLGLHAVTLRLSHFQVSLMIWYSRNHPLCLADFRGAIQKGLAQFPTDPYLLDTFIQSEQQSFISGRLRRYFDVCAPKDKTPLVWLFAIKAELWRYDRLQKLSSPLAALEGRDCIDEPETGVVHRIRSLFVKATQSRNGRHCPLLWRLYMKYEVEHNNLQQAKAAFYQGIHHCPWSKALCYDAAAYFPSEVSKFVEIMEEKQLRMKAPLEEVKLCLESIQMQLTSA